MIDYLPPKSTQYGEELKRIFNETRTFYEVTFQITENCNMACTYCYQHHKTNNKMTFETAKVFIDKLLNDEISWVNTKKNFGISINFIGGEPLLEIELIEKICNYIINKMIEIQHPWLYTLRFSICSNGLLYKTPKIQSFFEKYNRWISFTISVDGNEELHNSCRIDLSGNGTYSRVISSIRTYQNQYGNLPETKMTFSPNNITYIYDAILNLINIGYDIIPCNCVFEKGWEYFHATTLYYELKKIADYLIYNNLYNKINIRFFDENNFYPLPEEDNNNWCGGTDCKTISIDYKGKIYPCIRYMDSSLNNKQSNLSIGNINNNQLTESENFNLQLISNITRRSQSTDECFYCPIASGCSWCSGYNYEEFGTPNKRATYICCMHQAASLVNVYYWNTLYKYLNIDKKFKMYLPKDKALNIINEKEYNYLLNLIQGD